jgi:phosphoglucan, water dikinase
MEWLARLAMKVMALSLQVRAAIISSLASGLRNDAADDALVMRQRFRLADLRCEDYAFVLASRVLGILEASAGEEGLVGGGEKDWAMPVGALVLCTRHLGLSGWRPSECMALDEELSAWQKLGLATHRVNYLFSPCLLLFRLERSTLFRLGTWAI